MASDAAYQIQQADALIWHFYCLASDGDLVEPPPLPVILALGNRISSRHSSELVRQKVAQLVLEHVISLGRMRNSNQNDFGILERAVYFCVDASNILVSENRRFVPIYDIEENEEFLNLKSLPRIPAQIQTTPG